MATPVIMPRQGQSVETCIITEWHKAKGEKVEIGDTLFSYETDKAAFEEEAEVAGELLEIFFEVDEEVPVLTNVAVIGESGESVDEYRPDGDKKAESPASEKPSRQSEVQETATATAAREGGEKPAAGTAPSASEKSAAADSGEMAGGEKVSPRARRIAAEKKVPLEVVAGSGPGGRIIARDVTAAAGKTRLTTAAMRQFKTQPGTGLPAAGTGLAGRVRAADLGEAGAGLAAGGETRPLTNIRKTIAKRMLASLQNTAQLTLHATADARRLKMLRKKFKAEVEQGGPNITINDLVCFAVVKTLPRHPAINAHFLESEAKYFGPEVHLGLAVDTERGLMVPTIRNAHGLNIVGMAQHIRALAAACRAGNIDPELLDGASFTVTNLGAYGIESFTPVLNPPQVGILGVNNITYRPSEIGDGSIGFIPRMGLSLTFDHRALDGAPAAAFLQDVCQEIGNMEL